MRIPSARQPACLPLRLFFFGQTVLSTVWEQNICNPPQVTNFAGLDLTWTPPDDTLDWLMVVVWKCIAVLLANSIHKHMYIARKLSHFTFSGKVFFFREISVKRQTKIWVWRDFKPEMSSALISIHIWSAQPSFAVLCDSPADVPRLTLWSSSELLQWLFCRVYLLSVTYY